MLLPIYSQEEKMKPFSIDKIAHFSVSGMLYLIMYAIFHSVGWAYGTTLVIVILREARGWKEDSWYDMVCNIAGMLVSMWLVIWILR